MTKSFLISDLPKLSHRMSYQPKAAPTKVVARVPVPNKPAQTKVFSFSKYGSPERGGHNKGKVMKRRRSELVTGICHKFRISNRVERYSWVATWIQNGESKSKEFPYGKIKGKFIEPETARSCATFVRLSMEELYMEDY